MSNARTPTAVWLIIFLCYNNKSQLIQSRDHSSVLAWRIPGAVEPGGLPSMGSHRIGHDWSDLAAAAAASRMGLPAQLQRSILLFSSDASNVYNSLSWFSRGSWWLAAGLLCAYLGLCVFGELHVKYQCVIFKKKLSYLCGCFGS